MQQNRLESYGKGSADDRATDPASDLFYSMPQDYQDAWSDLRDRVEGRTH